jgi:hypothetical protein
MGREREGSGKKVFKKKVKHNQYISPEKWNKLSKEDRISIFKKREADDGKGQGYKPKKKDTDRQTSGASKVAEDEDTAEEEAPPAGAGNQFGSQVHGRGKKRKQE